MPMHLSFPQRMSQICPKTHDASSHPFSAGKRYHSPISHRALYTHLILIPGVGYSVSLSVIITEFACNIMWLIA